MTKCDIRISANTEEDLVKQMKRVSREFPSAEKVTFDGNENKIIAYGVEIHDALKGTQIYA